MDKSKIGISTEEHLHAAAVESLERRIMELALERTGARNGAIFLWDDKQKGLAIDFHVEEGMAVPLPNLLLRHRRDGRPNGIALWVYDEGKPWLCRDTARDPNYASYFLDVRSIAAAPILYQRRPIGVLTVSARETNAFTEEHLEELISLAASSATFLRRAQLYRWKHRNEERPFLIKGLSPEWLEVERKLEHVAATAAPVLIHGESGTGKELVAHAIHFNSLRRDKAFVSVNCAAIPETMLESILFGHVKGAFTGASFTKMGEFKMADGGTLFLDEIGEMPFPLQAKVLRAVEQGEIRPLGSDVPPARVDVRLVCATNRDLPQRVREGAFREDLYYRVSVVTLDLPPLRTYKNNLEVIAQAFLQQFNHGHGKQIRGISPAALGLLSRYSFPGNVRELRNIIEHAVLMTSAPEIRPEDLPRSVQDPSGPAAAPARPAASKTLRQTRDTWLAPLERQYLAELLEESGGNMRKAARRAGVNVVTLYRLIKKRGIRLGRRIELES